MSKRETKTGFESLSWSETLDRLVSSGAFPGAVDRCLIFGPPRTGKSSWACQTFVDCERVTLFQEQPIEDLIGCRSLESGPRGETVTGWVDGPVVRAMRGGKVLLIDEIDQFSPDVRCLLMAALDSREICRLTLPSGEVIRPSDGYGVIATTNAHPSELPDAVRQRFPLVVRAAEPSSRVTARLPAGFREMVQRHYQSTQTSAYTPPCDCCTVFGFDALSAALGAEAAARLIWGDDASDMLAAAAVQAG